MSKESDEVIAELEDDPLEEAFEQMFQALRVQMSEDLLQVAFRSSYLRYAGYLAPNDYMRLMKVATLDVFLGDPPIAAVARRLKITASRVKATRRHVSYPKVRDELIQYRDYAATPKTWNDHIADTWVQHRAFSRQFALAVSSDNGSVVTKALESIAERAAPPVRNQAPIVHIVLDTKDLEAEKETLKMAGMSKTPALLGDGKD